MSETTRLEERVTGLENEMAEVRYLAAKANKDASVFQTVLIGHTGVINAIRDDQLEHGKQLARVEKEMRTGFADVRSEMRDGFADVRSEMRDGFAKVDANFAKVDANFAKVDANFAKVEDQFRQVRRGQEAITDLLTRHLGEPGEELRASDADE